MYLKKPKRPIIWDGGDTSSYHVCMWPKVEILIYIDLGFWLL
jgi:hypothetical protein